MNYYEQLVEKLKEVPEIKKYLEEVIFWWCFVIRGKNWGIYIRNIAKWIDYKNEQEFIWDTIKILDNDFKDNTLLYKLTWKIENNLQERHLLIYLEKITLNNNWIIHFWITQSWELYSILDENPETIKNISTLDNIKEFHLQDDEVYKQILDYINN